MWTVEPYNPAMAKEWDAFVGASKNGTFLLTRPYMDYHADRFPDRSLVIRRNGRLAALLPATVGGPGVLSSHAGLTYGGFVMAPDSRTQYPLEWLDAIRLRLADEGFHTLVYKAVPTIYHRLPAQEDIYAMFRAGARMEACNIASVVPLPEGALRRLMRRAAIRMERHGITVHPAADPAEFWQIIVDDRRTRHNATPVHTLEEIRLLARRFPRNILLLTSRRQGRVIAGAVVYLMPESGVLHLQYAAANAEGFDIYAVDAIYHTLVTDLCPGYRWFDFGTSNERGGRYLNTGMTAHKEEFGGRPVVCPQFTLAI